MSLNPTRSRITFEIEPAENGTVLYQRVAPLTEGQPARGMLFFNLRATNVTTGDLTARQMMVSFPGSAVAPVLLPSRDVVIPAGSTRNIGLQGAESILLPAAGFTTMQVSVTVDGIAQPVVKSWPIAPHAKTYDFFAKPEADPGYGEFLVMPGIHIEGGGDQHFGYDVSVLGVNNNGKLSESKTGAETNTDRFLWGRPVYAMDDGIVVRAVDEHADNPSPDERAFARKSGSYQGTAPISAVAVANLSPQAVDLVSMSRMIVAVASQGSLRVVVLEQNADGSEVNFLCDGVGNDASGSVSVVGISATRAVTAHRMGGQMRLTTWQIAGNGSSVIIKDVRNVEDLADAKVVKLTSSRVALLGRTFGGSISLTVHSWDNNFDFVGTPGSATGGRISDYELLRLSNTRMAAAVRTLDSDLKVIVWDIVASGLVDQTGGGGISLSRVGESEGGGTISEVALASKDEKELVTAVRTSAGSIKLISWEVLANGALERRGDATDDEGTDVDLSYFKSDAYAVGYRPASGKLRLVAWETKQNDVTKQVSFSRLYMRETVGTTDRYAMARILTKQPTMITAVRTETNVLKIIPWQFTDSNLISILHGNELVQFFHLKQGSVPDHLLVAGTPVTKGEMVGRMGHSGRSADPHLHVHATRLRPELLANLDQLIETLAVGGSDIGEFRPLHFRDVRAVRKSGLVPGYANNPMSLLDGQGTYFETYAIWPAAGVAQQAGGRREDVLVLSR